MISRAIFVLRHLRLYVTTTRAQRAAVKMMAEDIVQLPITVRTADGREFPLNSRNHSFDAVVQNWKNLNPKEE